MNKLIFFLFIICILNETKGQENVYIDAVQYIYNSGCLKSDTGFIKNGKYDIFVSSEIIPFNLNSVESSILRLDYINNYNEFSNYNQEQEKIIKKVKDSLMIAEKFLNKCFQSKEEKDLNNLTTGEKKKYVLFFSNIIDNKLYAEVLPYDTLTFKDFKRENVAYGKVYSFLFLIDRGSKFLKVYTGEMYYK